MATMQLLISNIDDSAGKRQFQAYYCPACDEVRWCVPGQPQCFSEDDHDPAALMPAWVQR